MALSWKQGFVLVTMGSRWKGPEDCPNHSGAGYLLVSHSPNIETHNLCNDDRKQQQVVSTTVLPRFC